MDMNCLCYSANLYYNYLINHLNILNNLILFLQKRTDKIKFSKVIQNKLNIIFSNKCNNHTYICIQKVFKIMNKSNLIDIIKYSLDNIIQNKTIFPKEIIKVIIQYPHKFYIYFNENNFINFLNNKQEHKSLCNDELLAICCMYLINKYKNYILSKYNYDILYNLIIKDYIKKYNFYYNYNDLLIKQRIDLILEEEQYFFY